MIKFEKTEVFGWEAAIRGMRNPMNSWEKSDGLFDIHRDPDRKDVNTLKVDFAVGHDIRNETYYAPGECQYGAGYTTYIGPNDSNLMKKLSKAGTDHRKFMRMINVTVDITAPLYWWKEFDTYKVGTVANSCSTMHKIHEREFTLEDFSCEHIADDFELSNVVLNEGDLFTDILYALNHCRYEFIRTKNKKYWWQMIQLLPSSYNQKRTVQLNYEVLANIYKSRRNHKLDEWSVGFMEWIEQLPYAELITGTKEEELGEWIWTEDGKEDFEQYWVCSRCGEHDFVKSNYCCHCGKKMRVEEDNNA